VKFLEAKHRIWQVALGDFNTCNGTFVDFFVLLIVLQIYNSSLILENVDVKIALEANSLIK
jgi:hypothetical protein